MVSVASSGLVSPRIPARNNLDTAQSWLTKTPIKIAHFKFFALKASKLWMCRTLPRRGRQTIRRHARTYSPNRGEGAAQAAPDWALAQPRRLHGTRAASAPVGVLKSTFGRQAWRTARK